MSNVYDLIRRADGEVVASFPASGRWIVDTRDGAATSWRLNDGEYIATMSAFIELAELAGFIKTDTVKGHHA